MTFILTAPCEVGAVGRHLTPRTIVQELDKGVVALFKLLAAFSSKIVILLAVLPAFACFGERGEDGDGQGDSGGELHCSCGLGEGC